MRFDENFRRDAVEAVEAGWSQRDVAEQFGVARSTLSIWVRKAREERAAAAAASGVAAGAAAGAIGGGAAAETAAAEDPAGELGDAEDAASEPKAPDAEPGEPPTLVVPPEPDSGFAALSGALAAAAPAAASAAAPTSASDSATRDDATADAAQAVAMAPAQAAPSAKPRDSAPRIPVLPVLALALTAILFFVSIVVQTPAVDAEQQRDGDRAAEYTAAADAFDERALALRDEYCTRAPAALAALETYNRVAGDGNRHLAIIQAAGAPVIPDALQPKVTAIREAVDRALAAAAPSPAVLQLQSRFAGAEDVEATCSEQMLPAVADRPDEPTEADFAELRRDRAGLTPVLTAADIARLESVSPAVIALCYDLVAVGVGRLPAWEVLYWTPPTAPTELRDQYAAADAAANAAIATLSTTETVDTVLAAIASLADYVVATGQVLGAPVQFEGQPLTTLPSRSGGSTAAAAELLTGSAQQSGSTETAPTAPTSSAAPSTGSGATASAADAYPAGAGWSGASSGAQDTAANAPAPPPAPAPATTPAAQEPAPAPAPEPQPQPQPATDPPSGGISIGGTVCSVVDLLLPCVSGSP